jgi:hypothetical protein
MTLENRKRLLKHYEDTKQDARANAMRERIKADYPIETPKVEVKKETSKKSA